MMNIWGFVTAAVLLTLMPGPDILFVLTQGMTRGWRAGVVFAAGLCTGLVAHVTAAALGISVLLMSSEAAFMALKFAGAAYLLYLAFKAFRARRENHFRVDAGGGVVCDIFTCGSVGRAVSSPVDVQSPCGVVGERGRGGDLCRHRGEHPFCVSWGAGIEALGLTLPFGKRVVYLPAWFYGYPLAGCSLLGSVMPRTFSRLGVVGTTGGARYVWSMGGRSREQLRRACLFLLVYLF